MSQFTKNLELNSVLQSGVLSSDQRPYSTSFDQRRVVSQSGVVVNTAAARTYQADGLYGISDYYPLTVNATGILQVDIRDQRNCGDVIILNSAGNEVMIATPSYYSGRSTSITRTTINASGAYTAYIQVKGRSGAKYRVGIGVSST